MKPIKKSGWGLASLSKIASVLILISLMLSPLGTFPVLAMDSPVLTAPSDGANIEAAEATPLGVPVFEWQAVPEAAQYRFQLSNTIGFSTLVINITTDNTRYAPVISSLIDGLWYWRVRVEKPVASDYSSIWTFTRDWNSPATQPVLISPSEGEVLDFYDSPAFSWQPVTGAVQYLFQISSAADFLTVQYTATTVATSHQPKDKLANGLYYWRVTPLDPSGGSGAASEPRSFTSLYNPMVQLLEPVNYAYPTFTPNFSWQAVAGAKYYQLHYSTTSDFSANVTEINTENTSYTPVNALPNDVNYYWRVRVNAGLATTDWSETRTFRKQWYIQPQLLTPTNGFQFVRFPFFSWTPVAGASYYKIMFDDDPGFATPFETGTTSNTFFTPSKYESVLAAGELYYWRVIPYDKHDNPGVPSNSSSYRSKATYLATELIYPFYYYPSQPYMNPQENRTAALPLFLWHRLYSYPDGAIWPAKYRLTVGTDPNFNTVVWELVSENLGAAPTVDHPFTPVVGQDYYWKITPLNPFNQPLDHTSQTWRARFDPSIWINSTYATAGSARPELLRPSHGYELVEMTPTLEWKPVENATSYEVEVSTDALFSEVVLAEEVPYPVYVPTTALAQRSLGLYDYGTFYWRVRALAAGVPLSGGWSQPNRFQIASQGTWILSRGLGDLPNRLPVAADAAGDVSPEYDLTSLDISQDKDYWYFGFPVERTAQDTDFLVYLDLDHVDLSGADTDPLGAGISAIEAHRPEYAIHVDQTNSEYTPENVDIYAWDAGSGAYLPYQTLRSVGGDVYAPDLYGVAYNSDATAWAVGQEGAILFWDGAGWNEMVRPSLNTLRDVETISLNNAWAVGEKGTLQYWNGTAWQKMTSPTPQNLWDVHFVTSTHGWAAGDAGTMLYWNGTNWSLKTISGAGNLYAVDMIVSTADPAKNYGLAVGSSGTWLKWDSGLNAWVNQPTFTTHTLYDVEILNDNLAYAVGQAGVIYRWDGSTWSAVRYPVPAEPSLNGLYMMDANNGLAVGDEGVLLRWDGSAWTSLSTSTALNLYALDYEPVSSTALVVGENGKNLTWEAGVVQSVENVIAGYLELRLPNTSIGMGPSTGSLSVALISLDGTTPVDTLPSNDSPTLLTNFTAASERMNLRTPPDIVVKGSTPTDPRTHPSLLPYFYDYPVQSQWAGNYIETHLDAQFTNKVNEAIYTGKPTYYAQSQESWGTDLPDNTYFWRARPRYLVGTTYYTGAWSQGSSFKRIGLVPTNLKTSVTFATPTFSWDRVEGAAVYRFTLDDNADFTSPIISNLLTTENQYTPVITLNTGITYYWKVSIQRYGTINNDMFASSSFTLSLPKPEGLRHEPTIVLPEYYPYAPTFCWDPVIRSDDSGSLVLAAWKYRLQISVVDSFTSVFDTIDTEQHCWTSIKNYPDGQYFWRVAMIDGEAKLGPWSTTMAFTKQYPAPTLLAPENGGASPDTPMFEWTPVDSAASYVLQVAYDDKFVNLAFSTVSTSHVNYMPTVILAKDKLYYWRVAIKDKSNNQGPFSDATILIGTPKMYLYMPLVIK